MEKSPPNGAFSREACQIFFFFGSQIQKVKGDGTS